MKNIVRLFNAFIVKNKPLYVHYGITHRCNLRCKMCNLYQGAEINEELSIGEIERLFGVLRSLGVIYVSIGGGEPLLRKDIAAAVNLLIKKGFMVRLLTNGVLAQEDIIKDLVAAGLREVSISLDTIDPQKQDDICNSKGVWEKITEALRIFCNLMPRRGRRILINTVVSPLNIRELPELSRFAEKMGCCISFVPVESNNCGEFIFSKNDYRYIDESYDILIKMKRETRSNIFNSTLFLEKSRDYLKSNKRNWQCDAGKLYFSINPKGGFSICHNFNSEIAILKQDFKGFFVAKEFKKKRMDLIEQCPGCMRPCWAEISFLLNDKRSLWEMVRLQSCNSK